MLMCTSRFGATQVNGLGVVRFLQSQRIRTRVPSVDQTELAEPVPGTGRLKLAPTAQAPPLLRRHRPVEVAEGVLAPLPRAATYHVRASPEFPSAAHFMKPKATDWRRLRYGAAKAALTGPRTASTQIVRSPSR